MNRGIVRGACAVAAVVLAAGTFALTQSPSPAAPATPAAQASDFIGFHGAGPLTGEAAPLPPPPYRVRWTLKAGEQEAAAAPSTRPSSGHAGTYEGSAAIANGVVYVGDTAGLLRAIDLKSGTIKWTYTADDSFSTTPLVLHGQVMLGDLAGIFHAVNIADGKKLWTFDAGDSIHASANFVGPSRDRIVFGTDGAHIYCLDLKGNKLWEHEAGNRINGAPADAAGSALVSGCDGQLRAFAGADGKEEYTFDLGSLCPGSAAVAGDRMVLGTDGGRVICLTVADHKQLWLFENIAEHAMVYSSPAVADGIAVVGARDRSVYAINMKSGQKLWSYPTRGDVDSSPVISGGRVYVGSKDKKLYVLDLRSGKLLWQFTAGRGITATPAIAEGALVIGDTGGTLFCLEK